MLKLNPLQELVYKILPGPETKGFEKLKTKMLKDGEGMNAYFAGDISLYTPQLMLQFLALVFASLTEKAQNSAYFWMVKNGIDKNTAKGKLPAPNTLALYLVRVYMKQDDFKLKEIAELADALGWYFAMKEMKNAFKRLELSADINQVSPDVLLQKYQAYTSQTAFELILKERYSELEKFIDEARMDHVYFDFGVLVKPRNQEEAHKVLSHIADKIFICTALNQRYHDVYSPYFIFVVDPDTGRFIENGFKGYSGCEFYVITFATTAPAMFTGGISGIEIGLFAQLRNQYNVAVNYNYIDAHPYLPTVLRWIAKERSDIQQNLKKLIEMYSKYAPYLTGNSSLDSMRMKLFVQQEIFDFSNPDSFASSKGIAEFVAYFIYRMGKETFLRHFYITARLVALDLKSKKGIDFLKTREGRETLYRMTVERMASDRIYDDYVYEALLDTIQRKAENVIKVLPEDHVRWIAIHVFKTAVPRGDSEEDGREYAQIVYDQMFRPYFESLGKTMFLAILFNRTLSNFEGAVKNTLDVVINEVEKASEEEDEVIDFGFDFGEEDEEVEDFGFDIDEDEDEGEEEDRFTIEF